MIYIDNLCLKAFLPLPSPSGLANLGFDSYFSFLNIFYSFKYLLLLKLVYPCHPQVWPTWVARVTTMSHLLTVLSSSVSFLLTVHSLSVGFWKQSWFGELTMGRWTSTSTHWSTREACSACCFQVSLQRTGEARLLSSSRFENIYAQRILPALKKCFNFGELSRVQFQVRIHREFPQLWYWYWYCVSILEKFPVQFEMGKHLYQLYYWPCCKKYLNLQYSSRFTSPDTVIQSGVFVIIELADQFPSCNIISLINWLLQLQRVAHFL